MYVYFSDHPPPHCHVFKGGELVAVVVLATLEPRFPWQKLPRRARDLIAEHIDEIWNAFDDYNPPR